MDLSNFADENIINMEESNKHKRKPNWSSEESLALTTLVEEYKDIVRGKLGPQLTSQMKFESVGGDRPKDHCYVCWANSNAS